MKESEALLDASNKFNQLDRFKNEIKRCEAEFKSTRDIAKETKSKVEDLKLEIQPLEKKLAERSNGSGGLGVYSADHRNNYKVILTISTPN